MLLVGLLAGCSSGTSLNPVDWWHGLQDGPIADVRPPPPEADAPYPNLGSVPKRPPPADLGSRGNIMSGLVADRANAQYTAAQSPIGTIPPPAVPPKQPTAAQSTDSDDTSGATLQAASATPATITPPTRAPVRKVDQAALATPVPPTAATAATQATPTIPSTPPPPPSFAGVPATAPAPPAPKPPSPPVMAAPQVPGAPVSVGFEPGSAVLPRETGAALAQLAKTRAAKIVSVTGFGDATATDAPSQSAALPLALARARAISASLTAAGVPASAITLGAQATGRGGVAQIIN